MMTIKIKKLSETATLPEYKTKGAAGFDLCTSEKFTILREGGTFTVRTGLAMEIPEGYELQIRPRSGLARDHQITIVNTPGTVDADYRGEIMILLKNFGPYTKTFDVGERIAQAVINKIEKPIILQVDELTTTERGESGFGSTGTK